MPGFQSLKQTFLVVNLGFEAGRILFDLQLLKDIYTYIGMFFGIRINTTEKGDP